MIARKKQDFYEVQRSQWQKSLLVFAVLIVFYFLAIGLITLAVVASLGFLAAGPHLLAGSMPAKVLLAVLAVSAVIAVLHYLDARRFGAPYILKRTEAQPPENSDRYHKQFADTVEEMRIAAGLPRVIPYIIPSFAINSLALVEPDGTPAVAVTEGLLADCTRDELQGVAAHELAHISRGDAFYVTLVCSLANFLEKIQSALEPEDIPPEGKMAGGRGGAPPVLIYVTVAFSSFIMHLFSMLLSREREVLADAAACEISRNPAALARVLYKAHLKSSLVGDFSLAYSPLFIVAPRLTSDDEEGFFSRVFNSHPPLMRRIGQLARMANLAPANIIEQVWESQKMRDQARGVLHPFGETLKPEPSAGATSARSDAEGPRIWEVKDPEGRWQGPFGLAEVLFLPFFTPLIMVRNVQEVVEAPAREFLQIKRGLQNLGKKQPIEESRKNLCPRCRLPLSDTFYEGVEIQTCRQCGGKLVDASHMDRILLRREVAFSETLRAEAIRFKEEFLVNPLKVQKSKEKVMSNLLCPNCGYRLAPRPYNYQYFIPVNKCLSCYKIWFDADELEILQILVEKKA
jgi:Zn-dependent protease with chaperone function/Zn-finger nucleic acid-binding protein